MVFPHLGRQRCLSSRLDLESNGITRKGAEELAKLGEAKKLHSLELTLSSLPPLQGSSFLFALQSCARFFSVGGVDCLRNG